MIFALDCALGACAAGIFQDRVCCAASSEEMDRGHAARLPALAAEILARAGYGRAALGQAGLALAGRPRIDLIAVTVGPGSFTGLRAALGFAHGMAAGWGCAIVGVGVAEAFAEMAEPAGTLDGPLWVALHSRSGRAFLAGDGAIFSVALDALPPLGARPVVTGNAAACVAARLRARDEAATVLPADLPDLGVIARIGARRASGAISPLPAQPLYIDAPEARPAALPA